MNNSPKFAEATKRIAAKMAGERCAICEEQTSSPKKNRDGFINNGEGAHIYGANKAQNNRFDPSLSADDLKQLNNCIWLCNYCHKKIDSDEEDYTAESLFELREKHFVRVAIGKYGKSTFLNLDQLNMQIEQLQVQIRDKQELLESKERIFDLELNQFQMKLELLEKERSAEIDKYKSLLKSTEGLDNDITERIQSLIFEKNDLDGALELLSEIKLEEEEFKVAKNRILKGEVFLLKKEYSQASEQYQKAFEIFSSFEISSYYIRYLKSINDRKKLHSTVERVLEFEERNKNRPEKKLVLKASLGQLHSTLNPDLSIKYFTECLELINDELKLTPDFLLNKAGFTNYLAISYAHKGELKRALELCQEALYMHLSGKMQATDRERAFGELASLYNTVGKLYVANNNHREAVKYYKLALKICESELSDNLHQRLVTILNLLTSLTLIDIDEALKYASKSIELAKEFHEKSPLESFELLIGAFSKKSDVLSFMKRYDEAIDELENTERILKQAEIINPEGFTNLHGEILARKAMILVATGKKDEAHKELTFAIERLLNANESNRENNSKLATIHYLRSNLQTERRLKITDLKNGIELLELYITDESRDQLLLAKMKSDLENLT